MSTTSEDQVDPRNKYGESREQFEERLWRQRGGSFRYALSLTERDLAVAQDAYRRSLRDLDAWELEGLRKGYAERSNRGHR